MADTEPQSNNTDVPPLADVRIVPPIERFTGATPDPRTKWSALVDVAILLIGFPTLLAVLFGPFLQGGKLLVVHESDATTEWWWKRQYVGKIMHSGHLPQWNPYSMSGVPLLATSQPGPFYPGNWPYAFLPEVLVMNANILFHLWAGLAGMYVLVRWSLRRSVSAALLAAMVFGLGGVTIRHWHSGHLQFNAEIAMMPWALAALLLIYSATCGRAYLRGAIALSLVIALQFLAGHPQIVYYTLLVLGMVHAFWVLVCIVFWRTGWKPAILSTLTLGAALTLTAGMAAVQFLPLHEFAKIVVRTQNQVYEYFTQHSEQPSNLFTMVAPWAFGGKPGATNYYLGFYVYWETTAFTGAVILLVCLGAFVRLHRTAPIAWVCLAGALLCQWLAFGHFARAFGWAFQHVPGFNLFRCPGRLLIPGTVFVSLLGAIGLDELARLGARWRRFVAVLVLFAVLLTVSFIFFNREFKGEAGSAKFLNLLQSRALWLKYRPFDAATLQTRFSQFKDNVLLAFKIAAIAVALMPLLLLRWTRWVGCMALTLLGSWEIVGFVRDCRTSIDVKILDWPQEFASKLQQAEPMYRMASAHQPLDLCQGMAKQVRQLWGYETGVVQRYDEAIAGSQGVPPGSVLMNQPVLKLTPLLNALGLRYLIWSPYFPGLDSAWKPVLNQRGVQLLENPGALPRIRIVDSTLTASAALVVQLANSARFDPRRQTIVEAETSGTVSEADLTTGPLTAEPAGTLVVQKDEPEHLVVRTTMKRVAWLTVMDQLLPGWTATLDGHPASMYRANAIGRALQVPAGEHTIQMNYRAPGLRGGMLISSAAWPAWIMGLVLWVLAANRARKRERTALEIPNVSGTERASSL